MKLKTQNSKSKVILLLITYLLLLTTVIGCEAFRKKFVRKAKREKEIKVVIETYEYESRYSIEESYKRYFLFWRTAHEELINLLDRQDLSRKRRVFVAGKIVENLQHMRQLLLPEKQSELDTHILEQENILNQLQRYKLSHGQRLRIKSALKKQKRQIRKEFSYKDIQGYLIKE
ncbi:MAG: hypothetical protein NG712_00495 [Omnitrophica bacterium]|nr:hypothetical protein [Candidatus Omnitrophota bacterium]